MNDCRELEPLLASYVDDEAVAADRSRVEAHVEACPRCRERLSGQRAAREALHTRRAGVRGCAPELLKARCAAYARKNPATTAATGSTGPRLPLYRRWMPMTAAATLVLAVAAVVGLGLNDKAHALAFQTTVDHVKCARFHLSPTAPDPVASAAQWEATFGWPIRIPPSSHEPQLELRMVRRCAVTDGRVAHLIYLWRGEPVSVYVLPTRVLGESAELVQRFGHDATMWSTKDRTYMLVSQRHSDPSLDTVVAYMRANAY